jgi:hypothetical protein
MTITPKREGVLGFALYAEYVAQESNVGVSQVLYIPELVAPSNGQLIPIQVRQRLVTDVNPQRKWRILKTTGETKATIQPNKTFAGTHSIPEALAASDSYFEAVSNSFDALVAAVWRMEKEPFFVDISEADANDIHNGETPRGLIARVIRARAAAGYPALPGKAD